MLYDKRWNDPVYEGVSLRSFIAWLETKPADETYDFVKPDVCATAQYLQSRGHSHLDSMIDFGPNPMPGEPGYWLNQIVGTSPYTFGAALTRAREALTGTCD